MFFLTPRYIKEAKHYRHALKRVIHYKRDILSQKDLSALEKIRDQITAAIKERDRTKVRIACEEIEKAVGRIAPPPSDAGWRENVEVFLVAIVVAAGVRAYFLQPFKIPTGSMQPTLFGIVGVPIETSPPITLPSVFGTLGVQTESPLPNILKRAFDFIWLGRTYFDITAKEDDIVQQLREATYLNFFTFTDVICARHTYKIFAPVDTLRRDFGVAPTRIYKAGEPIVRGYVDTGDQVFVDKMSYNFMNPKRGDVFVFKTNEILQIKMPPGIQSQHYIKRLVGLPGDALRIDPPNLFINGKTPDSLVFHRVMSCQNGYRGYSNPPGGMYLYSPEDVVTVPPKSYFALGDNSYQSSDSRYWGVVPERNVTGRGLFVYWPFSKRWGFIQ